uniref:Uncharacterized protein n=1 Tax=Kalanchoe fedtschenkoi TaxID=63787 RepID=A0A7N0VGT8_KALFE
METLSSSVSTFRASAIPLPTIRPLSPSNYHHPHTLPSQPQPLSRRNSISNKHQHLPAPQPQTLVNPLSQSPSRTTPTAHLLRPSSGYAAALLDISLCHNSADLVFKDALRFAKLIRSGPVLDLMRNPFIGGKEKSQALKELAELGNLEKHLAALLKMLIVKNKFSIIGDVLDEFRRMYDALRVGRRASLATN